MTKLVTATELIQAISCANAGDSDWIYEQVT